jgi:hypothetical protein
VPEITARITRVANLSTASVGGVGGYPGSVRLHSDSVVPRIGTGTSSLSQEASEGLILQPVRPEIMEVIVQRS